MDDIVLLCGEIFVMLLLFDWCVLMVWFVSEDYVCELFVLLLEVLCCVVEVVVGGVIVVCFGCLLNIMFVQGFLFVL